MVPAAIGDDAWKETLQYLRAGIFVMSVFGVVHREGAKFRREMSDVMEQGTDNNLV